MIHFTLTGYRAGHLICGQARNMSDTHQHIPIQSQLKHTINMHGLNAICPQCMHEWVKSFRDDDDFDSDPSLPGARWEPATDPWVIELAKQAFDNASEVEQSRFIPSKSSAW